MVADLGPRVLVADGDPALRQRLYSKLLDVDIFSDCVADGRDTLEKLDEVLYTVVLLDLELPGVDPMTILDRLAAMPAEQRPVVLVLASSPDAARALDVEIVQIVLRKPINLTQVAELARSCVRTAAVRKQKQLDRAAAPPEGDQLKA
jgi:CheY-like chemotaxis protein